MQNTTLLYKYGMNFTYDTILYHMIVDNVVSYNTSIYNISINVINYDFLKINDNNGLIKVMPVIKVSSVILA